MNSEKNNNSLVKFESDVVLKGNKLLALKNKTLAPYYSELRQWWDNLDDNWKWCFLSLLDDSFENVDTLGNILKEPNNYELEKIILTREIGVCIDNDLSPLLKFPNLEIIIYQEAVGLRNLSGLEKHNNLKKLIIKWSLLSDLEPLRYLVSLEHLDFHDSCINNIEPLSNLINLKFLSIASSFVTDLNPLRKLTNLNYLDCSALAIQEDGLDRDFSPLGYLQNLKSLNLSYNGIKNLEFAFTLINLEYFNLTESYFGKLNIEPLVNLKELRELNLYRTWVEDIEPLFNLPNLKVLNIGMTNTSKSQILLLSQKNPHCTIIVEDNHLDNGTCKFYKNGELKQGSYEDLFP